MGSFDLISKAMVSDDECGYYSVGRYAINLGAFFCGTDPHVLAYVCMYVPTLPAMRTARGAPLIRWVCSGSRKGLVRVGFRCRRVGRLAEAPRTLPLLLLHHYCCC